MSVDNVARNGDNLDSKVNELPLTQGKDIHGGEISSQMLYSELRCELKSGSKLFSYFRIYS